MADFARVVTDTPSGGGTDDADWPPPDADEATRLGRRDQHLVADLDGTLVSSYDLSDENDRRAFEHARRSLGREPDLLFGTFASFVRPRGVAFLSAAFERNASVSMWSAGIEHYVEGAAAKLEKAVRAHDERRRAAAAAGQPTMTEGQQRQRRPRFAFVWSRRHCFVDTTQPLTVGADGEPIAPHATLRKPLSAMWNNSKGRLLGMRPDNTLLIEDTPSNGAEYPGNLVAVSRYGDEGAWAEPSDVDDDGMTRLWATLTATARAAGERALRARRPTTTRTMTTIAEDEEETTGNDGGFDRYWAGVAAAAQTRGPVSRLARAQAFEGRRRAVRSVLA